MNKYRLLIHVILLLSVALLHAEYKGEAGFQMLQITSGATQAGMAGTGFMYADNAFSIWDNAAAGMMNSSKVISANQNFWLDGTSLSTVAYSNPMGKTHFGIGAKYLDYGKLDKRDYTGLYLGEFHPMDVQMTLNWGIRLEASHYIGVNASYIYEKIDTASSWGGTADIGYVYKTPLRGTNTYIAMKHLGATSKMENESIDLPMTAEVGLTNLIEMEQIVVSTDIRAIQEYKNDFKAAFGVEGSFAGMLYLRAGYCFNNDREDFSFGAGVKLEKMGINYAFVPDKTELGTLNMVSISYKF